MIKYALYYAVKRDTGKLEVMALAPANELAELKAQAKKDLSKQALCKKYSKAIVVSYQGLSGSYKFDAPKESKKISEE